MTGNLNTFADWIFTVLTSIWNFLVNNSLLKWFVAIYILDWIIVHFRRYFGK